MKMLSNRFWQALIVILMPLVLVLGSVQVLATDAYLALEYAKTDFPPGPYGFTPDERFNHASENIHYVRAGQPVETLASQAHDNRPLYDTREISHMQDVQFVYQAARTAWLVSLVLVLLSASVLVRTPETRLLLARALGLGGGLTALLVLAASILAVVAWQAWFQLFHQVFFAAGTWTFARTDTLIRLFPEKFWFDAAISVTGASLALGVLLYLIGVRVPLTPETRPVCH